MYPNCRGPRDYYLSLPLQGIKLAIFQRQTFLTNLKAEEEQTILIEWKWTPYAQRTYPADVLQVTELIKMYLRILPAALEVCICLPKYQSCPRTGSASILDPAFHITNICCLWLWYSSRSHAICLAHCLDELLVRRLTAFNLMNNIGVSFWDIMTKRLTEKTRTDYCHWITQGAWMSWTLEVKWGTSLWPDEGLYILMKLVLCWKTLIYLDTFALAAVFLHAKEWRRWNKGLNRDPDPSVFQQIGTEDGWH